MPDQDTQIQLDFLKNELDITKSTLYELRSEVYNVAPGDHLSVLVNDDQYVQLVGSTLTIDGGTTPVNTDWIVEGTTNKYFTDGRAQTAVVSQALNIGVLNKAPSEDAVISYVTGQIDALVNGADTAYDTLLEIQTELQGNDTDIANILTAQSNRIKISEQVNEAAHGLAVGDVVDDNYNKVNVVVGKEVNIHGIVTAVADVDNFTLQFKNTLWNEPGSNRFSALTDGAPVYVDTDATVKTTTGQPSVGNFFVLGYKVDNDTLAFYPTSKLFEDKKPVLSTDLDADSHRVKNVADPINDTDALSIKGLRAIGGATYKGTINASNGTINAGDPLPPANSTTRGEFYRVTTAGTNPIELRVGEYVFCDGATYDVFGRYQNIDELADITADQLAFLSAITAGGGIAISSVDGLQTALDDINAQLIPATTEVQGLVELATDGETASNVVVQGSDTRLAKAQRIQYSNTGTKQVRFEEEGNPGNYQTIFPNFTTTQRDTETDWVNYDIIFNTTDNQPQIWTGTEWLALGGSGKGVPSVVVATVDNISIASAPAVLDGATLNAGDLILVKDQTTSTENGIYEFVASAAPLVRQKDFDTDKDWFNGTVVFVGGGTHLNDLFATFNADTFTLDNDALTFTKINPRTATEIGFTADDPNNFGTGTLQSEVDTVSKAVNKLASRSASRIVTSVNEADIHSQAASEGTTYIAADTGVKYTEKDGVFIRDARAPRATSKALPGANPGQPLHPHVSSPEGSVIELVKDPNGNWRMFYIKGDGSGKIEVGLGISGIIKDIIEKYDFEYVDVDNRLGLGANEAYSLIDGHSNAKGSNNLPIMQNLQPVAAGANPPRMIISGGGDEVLGNKYAKVPFRIRPYLGDLNEFSEQAHKGELAVDRSNGTIGVAATTAGDFYEAVTGIANSGGYVRFTVSSVGDVRIGDNIRANGVDEAALNTLYSVTGVDTGANTITTDIAYTGTPTATGYIHRLARINKITSASETIYEDIFENTSPSIDIDPTTGAGVITTPDGNYYQFHTQRRTKPVPGAYPNQSLLPRVSSPDGGILQIIGNTAWVINGKTGQKSVVSLAAIDTGEGYDVEAALDPDNIIGLGKDELYSITRGHSDTLDANGNPVIQNMQKPAPGAVQPRMVIGSGEPVLGKQYDKIPFAVANYRGAIADFVKIAQKGEICLDTTTDRSFLAISSSGDLSGSVTSVTNATNVITLGDTTGLEADDYIMVSGNTEPTANGLHKIVSVDSGTDVTVSTDITTTDGTGGSWYKAASVTDISLGAKTDIVTPPSAGGGLSNMISGKTLLVDVSSTNATDTRTGLNKYDEAKPFATISAALTAATSGDLVYVKPGTYPEQIIIKDAVDIHCELGVILEGINQNVSPTITVNTSGKSRFTGYATIIGYGTNPRCFWYNGDMDFYFEFYESIIRGNNLNMYIAPSSATTSPLTIKAHYRIYQETGSGGSAVYTSPTFGGVLTIEADIEQDAASSHSTAVTLVGTGSRVFFKGNIFCPNSAAISVVNGVSEAYFKGNYLLCAGASTVAGIRLGTTSGKCVLDFNHVSIVDGSTKFPKYGLIVDQGGEATVIINSLTVTAVNAFASVLRVSTTATGKSVVRIGNCNAGGHLLQLLEGDVIIDAKNVTLSAGHVIEASGTSSATARLKGRFETQEVAAPAIDVLDNTTNKTIILDGATVVVEGTATELVAVGTATTVNWKLMDYKSNKVALPGGETNLITTPLSVVDTDVE